MDPDVSKCGELNALLNDEESSKYISVALQLANNSTDYGSKLVAQMKHRAQYLSSLDSDQPTSAALTASEDVSRSSPSGSDVIISDVSSEDSSWEVVASCPVCRDDSNSKADQLIPCSLCNRSYHTWCVQIRKIPFSKDDEKHRRENYIKTHFGEWKCPHCTQLSKETAESPSTAHIPKNSTVDTFDLVEPGQKRKHLGSIGAHDDLMEGRKSTSAMSPSRYDSPAGGDGGCVIVTDKIHSSGGGRHNTNHHTPTNDRRRSSAAASPGIAATPDHMHHSSTSKHPQTPSFSSSKHDQIALLIGCLSENNLTVEDLMAMSSEKRRDTITNVVQSKLSGMPANTLNSIQYAKQFDLATAMKGILANNAGLLANNAAALSSNGGSESVRSQAISEGSTESQSQKSSATNGIGAGSAPGGASLGNSYVQVEKNNLGGSVPQTVAGDASGGSAGAPFDARKNMIELIKKKAAAKGATSDPAAVDAASWSAPLTPFAQPNAGGIAFPSAAGGSGAGGVGGGQGGPAIGFGSNFTGGFGMGTQSSHSLGLPGAAAQGVAGGEGAGAAGSGVGGQGSGAGGAGGNGTGAGGTGSGSGSGSAKADDGLDVTKVKELPEFVKYFKMMKVGIAKNAVAEKLFADGVVDSQQLALALLGLDPDQPLPENFLKKPPAEEKKEEEKKDDVDKKVPVSEHPKYAKYFKMLKVGLPKEAIKAKMTQEGVDEKMLDLEPGHLISLEEKPKDEGKMVPVSEHPKYAKFFKMLKVGLPKPAIKVKMTQEGVDPEMIEKDPSEMIPLDDSPKVEMVPVGEHPKYVKYFKMMKVGLPKDAIKAKMIQEGVDPKMIDKDPKDLIPLDEKAEVEEMVAVSEHPLYAKYFKMKKVGLATEAIKAKMTQEGVDPSYIDKDPKDMVPVNPKKEGTGGGGGLGGLGGIAGGLGGLKGGLKAGGGGAAVSKVKKKKIYWKALDASKVSANSLWAAPGGEEDIVMDEEEFNKLFVDTGENSAKEVVKVVKEPKKQKVNIINMKRAQNAGIALARIRFKYEDMREKIMNMDDEGLTTDQLKSLEEFLPTPEETGLIKAYKGDILLLGQAEKYMLVMLGFDDAPKRIKCMIYKQQFKSRVLECRSKLSKIENACDDVKLSARLKKVLKTILKVGNQLNDGEEHKGFTLDSLLKLQSAKAFDKKTSILQYVIMLIYRNDPDCLRFNEDLKHVGEASRLTFESVAGEKNALKEEFDANFKIVMDIAENDPDCNTGSMIDFLQKVMPWYHFSDSD